MSLIKPNNGEYLFKFLDDEMLSFYNNKRDDLDNTTW